MEAKAKGQSDMYFSIQNLLTDEEEAVFRRGRNAKVILCLKCGFNGLQMRDRP